jgi:hypothetical protein
LHLFLLHLFFRMFSFIPFSLLFPYLYLAQDGDRWQHVCMRLWTFGLHNMWGISWLAEEL